MKILFVAVFHPTSTNVSQSDGFKKNGYEVYEYNYRKRAQVLRSNQLRDEELLNIYNEYKPDVVVFSKCNEINPNIIDKIDAVKVLWYMDPLNEQFTPSFRAKIEKCDITFCSLWEPYLAAKEVGGDKVHFLHEGYDHTSNYPIDIPYEHDVSFIGVLRNKRLQYHNALKFPVINGAFGVEHSEAVCKSKINLNFTEGGTSDRTYKVLASKGFLLTEAWPKMEEDFTNMKDLVTFDGVEDLRKKIDYYLRNESERLTIAEEGYKTVQKFSRINWAKNIIDKCKELTNI